MPYIHYAGAADVWKHLSLCSFLKNESPRTYVETNSAFPRYALERTDTQEYGVYTFFENASRIPLLLHVPYYQEIAKLNAGNSQLTSYLGSPGLAMKSLADISEEFVFFDIEQEPLEQCLEYANELGIGSKVKVRLEDSVDGVFSLLPALSSKDFIHFDPYEMWYKSGDIDYADVFVEATRRGIKCMVWYGFHTLQEKQRVYEFFSQKLKKLQGHDIRCVEMIMDIIKETEIRVDPRIIGSGILISNLTRRSFSDLDKFSDALVGVYKDTFFRGSPGGLYKEEVFFNK